MSTRHIIRCAMCDEAFEDDVLFKHLRDEHDLDFDLIEVPADTAELVLAYENDPVLSPLEDRLAHLDRISLMIDAERWPWMRWYHRWELNKLRLEHERLREDQLQFMLEKETSR
jgi:hypothetical protein